MNVFKKSLVHLKLEVINLIIPRWLIIVATKHFAGITYGIGICSNFQNGTNCILLSYLSLKTIIGLVLEILNVILFCLSENLHIKQGGDNMKSLWDGVLW